MRSIVPLFLGEVVGVVWGGVFTMVPSANPSGPVGVVGQKIPADHVDVRQFGGRSVNCVLRI